MQGHVDGIGTLKRIHMHKSDRIVTVAVPTALSRYIVEKGSIAVNGISLTVIDARRSHFSVGIIPHTWDATMLHELSPGDTVNIEVDVLAKYVEKLIQKHSI